MSASSLSPNSRDAHRSLSAATTEAAAVVTVADVETVLVAAGPECSDGMAARQPADGSDLGTAGGGRSAPRSGGILAPIVVVVADAAAPGVLPVLVVVCATILRGGCCC